MNEHLKCNTAIVYNVRSNVGNLQLVSHWRGTCETETLSIDLKWNYKVELRFSSQSGEKTVNHTALKQKALFLENLNESQLVTGLMQ